MWQYILQNLGTLGEVALATAHVLSISNAWPMIRHTWSAVSVRQGFGNRATMKSGSVI